MLSLVGSAQQPCCATARPKLGAYRVVGAEPFVGRQMGNVVEASHKIRG